MRESGRRGRARPQRGSGLSAGVTARQVPRERGSPMLHRRARFPDEHTVRKGKPGSGVPPTSNCGAPTLPATLSDSWELLKMSGFSLLFNIVRNIQESKQVLKHPSLWLFPSVEIHADGKAGTIETRVLKARTVPWPHKATGMVLGWGQAQTRPRTLTRASTQVGARARMSHLAPPAVLFQWL